MSWSGLEMRDVSHSYLRPRETLFKQRGRIDAVIGATLSVGPGETLGIVGESGSGKSTLGRIAAGLEKPVTGSVLFDGARYAKLNSSQWRHERRLVQTVFQNPGQALDPRKRIAAQIVEALDAHERPGAAVRAGRLAEMLDLTGLGDMAGRFPHQLSGGQLQRAVIARALILRPRLLICDEAVSALDVSVQAQIINLLVDLRGRFGIAIIFISHDLSVVRHLSARVAVMRGGRIVESGVTEQLYARPTHDYTRSLLAAVPATTPTEARRRRGDAPVLRSEAMEEMMA